MVRQRHEIERVSQFDVLAGAGGDLGAASETIGVGHGQHVSSEETVN